MKFAILGAGGTGGCVGGYLAHAGNDVTFLARGAWPDRTRSSSRFSTSSARAK